MNKKEMISRRIAKGYNRKESLDLLNEILNSEMSKSLLIATLVYWNFISVKSAEKMEQN
jgi:hypothetical protein